MLELLFERKFKVIYKSIVSVEGLKLVYIPKEVVSEVLAKRFFTVQIYGRSIFKKGFNLCSDFSYKLISVVVRSEVFT